jgi:hypothetical protein
MHSQRTGIYNYIGISKLIPICHNSPFCHAIRSRMSTERQKQASRANGAKSRGPVTPAGKLASSRNAITHGMLSGTIVLQGESTDRFLSLVAVLHEEFQPQTPFEESLIQNMAVARWRQMRIWGLEKAGMEYEMRRQSEMPNSISTDILHADVATRASLAFRALSDDSRSIELINRYDSRYERQYYRAHRRFLEVRDRRTPPSSRLDRSTFPADGGETPGSGKSVISKGTREVVANKATPINGTHQPAVLERIATRLSRALFVLIRVHSWPIPGFAQQTRGFDSIKC